MNEVEQTINTVEYYQDRLALAILMDSPLHLDMLWKQCPVLYWTPNILGYCLWRSAYQCTRYVLSKEVTI